MSKIQRMFLRIQIVVALLTIEMRRQKEYRHARGCILCHHPFTTDLIPDETGMAHDTCARAELADIYEADEEYYEYMASR